MATIDLSNERCSWCGESADLVPATYSYIHKAECRDWDGCAGRVNEIMYLFERLGYLAILLGRAA
jgi:hypothetical protein